LVRPTINSEKHIVQIGFNQAAIAAVSTTGLISSNRNPSNSRHVRIGAVVKAIYVELWFLGEGNAVGTSIAMIEKLIGDGPAPTTPDMLALHDYANKKNMLWTHQGLTSETNANAVPVIRGWLKIPKGKQRFGQGDSLELNLQAQVIDFNFCGLAIFKEYF